MSEKDKIELVKQAKGIIFDLDGTLADSMGIWKDIDVVFLARYGQTVPDDLNSVIEGMSFSETAQYFKSRFNLPLSIEDIKEQWNDMAYDKYHSEIELKPGVAEFLPWLKARGCLIAIASSNSRELIKAVLSAHNIEKYFSVIVTSCDVNAGKPAPDVYLKTAKLLQIAPESCLVFEDVPAGIQAGKAAGMSVIAVEDDFSAHLQQEKASLADGWINDYRELIFKELRV